MTKPAVFSSAIAPFRFVFFMWVSFIVEFILPGLEIYGIHPRSVIGLVGIFTSPFIHHDLYHLISNTIPLLFLGGVIYFFYKGIASIIFYRSFFWTNVAVWLFAGSNTNHIGASGIVYAFAVFLIFFGIFYRDFWSIVISVIVFAMYGGIFYGMLPFGIADNISWESHLSGALVGLYSAIDLSRKNKR